MSLMGLDVGTTGCKAVIFDLSGRILASHYKAYPMRFPGPGQCELDTEEVCRAVHEVISHSAREVQARDPVEAVGISTLGDSVTLVDEAGKPLSGTVLGAADRRAAAQAKWLDRRIGRDALFSVTGTPLHAFCAVPKIMWFREHRPEIFKRAAKFCGLQEIVHRYLGLNPAMDFSLAGRTMLLDIRSREPAVGVFAEAGIEPDRFFPMVQATRIAGHMKEPKASEYGLSEGVAVVVGGFDQSCCALGAGVIQEGMAALSVGTLEAITPVFREMRLEPPLLEGNHGCIPGLIEGYYSSLAYVTTSGAVIDWYHTNFDATNATLGRLFDSVPEGPSGVFVMPYFAGSGTPWLDIKQLGSAFGLSLETGKAQLFKGILEGIAYEVKLNIDSFQRACIPVKALRAIGGGSRSDTWMQLKADILGIPIERTLITEAGCLGAAFLAGLGTQRYTRPEEIADIVSVDRVFEPRLEMSNSYEHSYARYLRIRDRIENLDLS
ncbi:MAG: FGGY family carbohydrate kinase [Spirochaetes bacterium]|nr:FGGY family carbohydrate kinase [Spirochaetota bacterium]